MWSTRPSIRTLPISLYNTDRQPDRDEHEAARNLGNVDLDVRFGPHIRDPRIDSKARPPAR
jgi:hypothetical protein